MKEVKFRSARANDLPILYEFEQEIIKAERPLDKTLKPDTIYYYDLMGLIKASDTELVVGLWKNEIVCSGYAKVKKAEPFLKNDVYAHLGFMYVKPEFRGRGINQKLIEKLKLWAKTKNINELRLDVYEANESAVRAYEKAGFNKNLVEMRMEI